jgi:hypothetical protein
MIGFIKAHSTYIIAGCSCAYAFFGVVTGHLTGDEALGVTAAALSAAGIHLKVATK